MTKEMHRLTVVTGSDMSAPQHLTLTLTLTGKLTVGRTSN